MKIDKMTKIRKFKVSDTKKVASLIRNTFLKFNIKESSKKGIDDYINFYNTDRENIKKLEEIFSESPILFVAIDNEKVIGIVRGNKNKLTNLFILGEYHNRGFGRNLIKKFENEAKKIGSRKIKIKSSLFAVSFYTKLGYKKTSRIRIHHGIKIQPMEKVMYPYRGRFSNNLEKAKIKIS